MSPTRQLATRVLAKLFGGAALSVALWSVGACSERESIEFLAGGGVAQVRRLFGARNFALAGRAVLVWLRDFVTLERRNRKVWSPSLGLDWTGLETRLARKWTAT